MKSSSLLIKYIDSFGLEFSKDIQNTCDLVLFTLLKTCVIGWCGVVLSGFINMIVLPILILITTGVNVFNGALLVFVALLATILGVTVIPFSKILNSPIVEKVLKFLCRPIRITND